MTFTKLSPDIHEDPPEIRIPVNAAGIKGLYIEASIKIGEECRSYPIKLSVHVDLPEDRKGVHLSRLANSVIAEAERGCLALEDLLTRISNRAVLVHPPSSYAETEAEIAIPRNGQMIPVSFRIKRYRSGTEKWEISVEVEGNTSCPCAKEVFRFYEKTEWELTPTHMQRATARIVLEGDSSFSFKDAIELVEIAESSFSGRLEISLSRDEEKEAIKKAINNPLFAEDLARVISWRVSRSAPGIKSNRIKVNVESYESIHPYNVFAEVVLSGEELRNRSRNKEL